MDYSLIAMELVYKPWATENLSNALQSYRSGELPSLDLEFTKGCNLSCWYCDSDTGRPDPNELKFLEKIGVIEQARILGAKQLYICGLGEPSIDSSFRPVMEHAHNLGFEISMFTNGINITRDLAKWYFDNEVNLLIKFDTLKPNVFDEILGREGAAERIYKGIEHLLAVGYTENDKLKLGTSIVPTRSIVSDIPNAVRFCVEHHMYPLVAELEYSGRARDRYSQEHLSDSELKKLKADIEKILGFTYSIPVCPAFLGLHVNHLGKVMVDRNTGISCDWWRLEEPDMVEIGDTRLESVGKIWDNIRKYRRDHSSETKELRESIKDYVFGGCGGQPKEILSILLEL